MKKYETYKDSGIKWYGEIPSHWEIKRLKAAISEHFSGSWGEDEQHDGNDYLCIRIADFDFESQTVSPTAATLRHYTEKQLKSGVLQDNDLLLEKSGGGDKTPVGRVVIYKQKANEVSMFANFCECLRVRKEHIPRFIAYMLKVVYLKTKMRQFYKQTTGLQNIDVPDYLGMGIILPSRAEQEAIVAFLDKKTGEIDDLVAQVEREIVLLKEYKQAEIARVVTKGLNSDVPMKPSGISWIGDIPKHWRLKSLRNYLRLVSDKGHPNEQLLSVVREQGVIIRDGESQDENHNFIPDDLSGYKLVKAGQFAINKMKSWQGSYGVSSFQGIVSPAYYVCDLNFGNKQFFNEAIRSKVYVPFFTQYSKGIRVGQWDLSPIGLKSIPFIEPPLSEQQEIVEYINHQTTEIDRLIVELTYQVEYLKEYKQRLIADVVTGKINVQPN